MKKLFGLLVMLCVAALSVAALPASSDKGTVVDGTIYSGAIGSSLVQGAAVNVYCTHNVTVTAKAAVSSSLGTYAVSFSKDECTAADSAFACVGLHCSNSQNVVSATSKFNLLQSNVVNVA